ncbi:hypothetical protein KI387_009245, partial [Taxus chinensis]
LRIPRTFVPHVQSSPGPIVPFSPNSADSRILRTFIPHVPSSPGRIVPFSSDSDDS